MVTIQERENDLSWVHQREAWDFSQCQERKALSSPVCEGRSTSLRSSFLTTRREAQPGTGLLTCADDHRGGAVRPDDIRDPGSNAP